MRISWVTSLVFLGFSFPQLSLEAQQPIDFAKLQAEVVDKGVQAVVNKLRDSHEQLASALAHVQPYLQENRQQLWFQLQARTRMAGWEDFQRQLRAQTPDETLIALTSKLDAVPTGVRGVWRFGNGPVTHLGLSSDRKQIYCGSSGTFAVIDARTLEVVRRFDNVGFVCTTLVGPDGDLFCASQPLAGGSGLSLLDVQSGQEMAKQAAIATTHGYLGNVPMPAAIITSPDGLKVIQETDEIRFRCRDIDGSGETINFSGGGDTTFCDTVLMRFVDGGTQLLTADNRGHVRHFAFPGCKESQPGQYIKGASVSGYDLSPDESLLACSFAGNKSQGKSRTHFGDVSVWDRLTGRELIRHQVHDDALVSTVFLGDGESVVAGGLKGRLYAWTGKGGQPIRSAPHDSAVARMLTAPDGKYVFSGDIKGFIKLTDPMAAGELGPPLPDESAVRQHGVSPDGAWEAQIRKRAFTVLQVASGKTLDFQLNDADAAALGDISSIALRPDKGYATLGGTKPAVLHYHLRSKQTKLVKLDAGDGKQLTYFARFYERGKPRIKFRMIVTPGAKHAVVWGQKTVASFNTFTGAKEFELAAPIRHFGRRYGFLSGERMAINYQAQVNRGQTEGLRIYDLGKGKEVANLQHGAYQRGIAINAKTDTIVTSGRTSRGSVTPQLLIWDANTGERQQQALPESYGDVIGITEDGRRFLTLATRPAVVFVWDLATRQVIGRFDIGIDVTRGRMDGSTLVLGKATSHVGDDQTEYWFEYHQAQ